MCAAYACVSALCLYHTHSHAHTITHVLRAVEIVVYNAGTLVPLAKKLAEDAQREKETKERAEAEARAAQQQQQQQSTPQQSPVYNAVGVPQSLTDMTASPLQTASPAQQQPDTSK